MRHPIIGISHTIFYKAFEMGSSETCCWILYPPPETQETPYPKPYVSAASCSRQHSNPTHILKGTTRYSRLADELSGSWGKPDESVRSS